MKHRTAVVLSYAIVLAGFLAYAAALAFVSRWLWHDPDTRMTMCFLLGMPAGLFARYARAELAEWLTRPDTTPGRKP